jgi:hypothetical protein
VVLCLPLELQPSGLRFSFELVRCLPCPLVNLSTGRLIVSQANWPTNQLYNFRVAPSLLASEPLVN